MSVRDERIHQIVMKSMDTIQDKFDAQISQYGYFKVLSIGCLFICKKPIDTINAFTTAYSGQHRGPCLPTGDSGPTESWRK